MSHSQTNSFGVVATVKDFGADFALSFGFGAVFDAGFGNFDGSVIVQFDNSFLGKKNKDDEFIRFYIDSFKKMNKYVSVRDLPIIYSKPYTL